MQANFSLFHAHRTISR